MKANPQPPKSPPPPPPASAGAEDPNPAPNPHHASLPDPVPVVRPPRKLDLALAALPVGGDIQPVTQLGIRLLKGVGQMFTSNLEHAYQFRGLVHKPAGSFEEAYQIIAGDILTDPRIARLTQAIAFIPCYAWSTFEVVLHPLKLTTYGQKVLADLSKLQREFPRYKAFIQWEDGKHRHVVYRQTISAAETELIDKVQWPDKDTILAALELTAFDSIAALSQANDDIRTLLSAQEV